VGTGTICVTDILSEGIDDRGDEGGSGKFRCLWFLARCRVIKGSGTVGFLRLEGSLTGQVVGG